MSEQKLSGEESSCLEIISSSDQKPAVSDKSRSESIETAPAAVRKDSNTGSETTTTEIESSIRGDQVTESSEAQNHRVTLQTQDSDTVTLENHNHEALVGSRDEVNITQTNNHQTVETSAPAVAPVPSERSPTPGTPCSDGRKMNGLSFTELCCLFCCPPCPGQIAGGSLFVLN